MTRILRRQMRELPFLTAVKGASGGVRGNFRRAFQLKESEVESLAKAHGFRLSTTESNRFCLEPIGASPKWGIDLKRGRGRIIRVEIVANEDFTPRHRERIMEFLKELAPKLN